MANFQPRALGKQSLLNTVKALCEKIKNEKANLDICLNIPVSQVTNPTSPDVHALFDGFQFIETIPLAIFTRFPKGRMIAAIFDREDAKISQETIQNLEDLGFITISTDSYEKIDFEKIIEQTNNIEETAKSARHPVGMEHFKALTEFERRFERLKEHNLYLLLNEVSCSSVAEFSIKAVFDPESKNDLALWQYIKKTSFDILVVEKEGMNPVLAVEFDGPTHLHEEQIEKDNLKNNFCSAINLPLIRIDERYIDPAYENHSEWVIETIRTTLRKGIVWRTLAHARRQLDDREDTRKIIEEARENTSTNEDFLCTILDEISKKNALEEYMLNCDRQELNREYEQVFQEPPKVTYSTKSDSRISATLHWGQGFMTDTPCGVKLSAYGLHIDTEKIVKDYLYEWLVENRISLEKGNVPRRS